MPSRSKLRRFRDGAHRRPATINAADSRPIANASLCTPFRDRLCAVADPNVPNATRVSCLGALVEPCAVLRFVIAVVMDALDCVVALWARPHIGEKAFKPSLSVFT